MFDRKKTVQFISSAAASDGGSLTLILCNHNQEEFWVILDRKIGTQTYSKIFYEDRILSSIEEKQLLFWLENILSTKLKEEVDRKAITEFISTIKSRE